MRKTDERKREKGKETATINNSRSGGARMTHEQYRKEETQWIKNDVNLINNRRMTTETKLYEEGRKEKHEEERLRKRHRNNWSQQEEAGNVANVYKTGSIFLLLHFHFFLAFRFLIEQWKLIYWWIEWDRQYLHLKLDAAYLRCVDLCHNWNCLPFPNLLITY